MTALAATDVTVTISTRHIDDMPGHLRRVYADLDFGDSALTYPSGGIPLPAKEQFGFKKEIVLGNVEQPSDGFIYKFDRTNHKLMVFTMGIVTAAAGSTVISITMQHYYVENSSGSHASILLPGATAADETVDLGPLIELPTSIALDATTIRVELVGE